MLFNLTTIRPCPSIIHSLNSAWILPTGSYCASLSVPVTFFPTVRAKLSSPTAPRPLVLAFRQCLPAAVWSFRSSVTTKTNHTFQNTALAYINTHFPRTQWEAAIRSINGPFTRTCSPTAMCVLYVVFSSPPLGRPVKRWQFIRTHVQYFPADTRTHWARTF